MAPEHDMEKVNTIMSKSGDVYNFSFSTGSSKEIDLRKELFATFFGNFQEEAKSQKGLLRKIKFDNKGKPILCPCVDPTTREQDRDYFCPICLSERYLFNETFLDFYKVQHASDNSLISKPYGLDNVHNGIIYTLYNANIGDYDKIVEVNLDLDGKFIYPIERTDIWQITEIVPLRLDTGKLQFLKIFARHEDVKYLKAPLR